MSTLNTELVRRIKSLPPLPESVVRIQEICSNPESGIADLTKVIDKDPMMTANLLKAANSPLYGFSREIKNISQAVSLFGMATVKGFALAGAVKSSMQIDMAPYGRSAADFSDISQLQSALMLSWYGKIDREMMNVLAPASFLDGVGEIIMAAEVITQGKTAEFKALIESKATLEEAEQEFFGAVSMEVAAEVFTRWRLEPLMIRAIESSHEPEKADPEIKPYAYALKAVRQAINLKERFSDAGLAAARATVQEAGLDEEGFVNAIKVVNLS